MRSAFLAANAARGGRRATLRRDICSRAVAQGGTTARQSLVELKDVSYSFGSTTIIGGLNFELKEGETVCLLGPSGTRWCILNHEVHSSWVTNKACLFASSLLS
eukprot:Plantae.Rhodophyta-Purpureofilum_apyrenoidigerum.ctg28645.p1 GENE.Plantae.Rhodophyta-Purpureofilum_apyrenoidigerum.ctg28645~~Plantae.Rhodophyta-Purpureofilum_apyrenoidigerum.ctg28645.p1  ORF type:complete len:104 (-),score=7.25 Plantae.Rhodophyta-Purpureofilum_apyrenoidigerum.ctg28645:132-443(-)